RLLFNASIFFFQAADGIRDFHVTGVQTCALPISRFGDGTGPVVHIRFNSAKAERSIAFNPELKLAECYMDGGYDFVEGDIYTLRSEERRVGKACRPRRAPVE